MVRWFLEHAAGCENQTSDFPLHRTFAHYTSLHCLLPRVVWHNDGKWRPPWTGTWDGDMFHVQVSHPKLRLILARRSPVRLPVDVQRMVRARSAVGTQNKLGAAKSLSLCAGDGHFPSPATMPAGDGHFLRRSISWHLLLPNGSAAAARLQCELGRVSQESWAGKGRVAPAPCLLRKRSRTGCDSGAWLFCSRKRSTVAHSAAEVRRNRSSSRPRPPTSRDPRPLPPTRAPRLNAVTCWTAQLLEI